MVPWSQAEQAAPCSAPIIWVTAAESQWRWLGGPEGSDAPLKIRQQVRVYDAHVSAGQSLSVPLVTGMTPWLYVMEGDIGIGRERLGKGDAITDLEVALPDVHAISPATLVLFLVDLAAPASLAERSANGRRRRSVDRSQWTEIPRQTAGGWRERVAVAQYYA